MASTEIYAAEYVVAARNPQWALRSGPRDFIHRCRPTLSKKPPSGPGWGHEVKHDGYRLQVHTRDRRVRLFAMNAADWTERYPQIVEEAARLKRDAVLDCELICQDKHGCAGQSGHSTCTAECPRLAISAQAELANDVCSEEQSGPMGLHGSMAACDRIDGSLQTGDVVDLAVHGAARGHHPRLGVFRGGDPEALGRVTCIRCS